MKESDRSLPILIVVTGRPAAGKTTLANILASEIRCPKISRDEIKEGLVNTIKNVEQIEDGVKWQVYEAFFSVIEILLSNRITLIAEAAFQHKLWQPKLKLLKEIAQIKIVHCSIDPKLARLRFVRRGLFDPQRAYFHGEKAMQTAKEAIELPASEYNPPMMNVPTIEVDTSEGYEPKISEIVSFIDRS